MRRGLTISLFLFAFVSSTMAQTSRVEEAIKQIPIAGHVVEDFVPKGWVLYEKASGDLNRDRLADAALTITLPYEEADKLKESGDYKGAPNIVIVLFGKRGGGFTRFAVNGKLYPEDGDSRSYMSPSIKNGVLALNNNWGDVTATDVTYRFRYNAATKKLMLIGFDFEEYSRANNNDGSRSSENYVTGMVVMYTKFRSSESNDYQEIKRAFAGTAKVAFEETVIRSREYGRAPF